VKVRDDGKVEVREAGGGEGWSRVTDGEQVVRAKREVDAKIIQLYLAQVRLP